MTPHFYRVAARPALGLSCSHSQWGFLPLSNVARTWIELQRLRTMQRRGGYQSVPALGLSCSFLCFAYSSARIVSTRTWIELQQEIVYTRENLERNYPHLDWVAAAFRGISQTFSQGPHLDWVAAESLYTSLQPSASVRIVAYSRGGACPTGHGSTPCGEPRLDTVSHTKI